MEFGLERFDVKVEDTHEYALPLLDAVLFVKPATEANKPYFNKVLKKSKKRLNELRRKGVSAEYLEENRDEDRILFPQYIIVGWKGMKDKEGNPVEFSVENCEDLLKQMPNWMFDEIREYVNDVSNFIDVMDIEEKVKN
jgi:hypothetical protein